MLLNFKFTYSYSLPFIFVYNWLSKCFCNICCSRLFKSEFKSETINLFTVIWYSNLVTGNANYRMTQTSFTLMGFTQPQTALTIIEDAQNNEKGFTSRLLWFFPKPVFCCLKDTELTPEESAQVRKFKDQLGMIM